MDREKNMAFENSFDYAKTIMGRLDYILEMTAGDEIEGNPIKVHAKLEAISHLAGESMGEMERIVIPGIKGCLGPDYTDYPSL